MSINGISLETVVEEIVYIILVFFGALEKFMYVSS